MTDFNQKLNEITLDERLILQCLSIFWEPITATDLYRLLRELGLRSPAGKYYSAPDLKLFKEAMFKKGILENLNANGMSGFRIAGDELKECLTREARSESWFDGVVETIQLRFNLSAFLSYFSYGNDWRYILRLLRDYRLSIYQKQTEKAGQLFEQLNKKGQGNELADLAITIFSNPFQQKFLAEFDQEFQGQVLILLITQAFEQTESAGELWAYVDEHDLNDLPVLGFYQIQNLVLNGELAEAKTMIGDPDNLASMLTAATIEFLKKNFVEAAKLFAEGVKLWRTVLRKKKGYPDDWQMFFYGLSLWRTAEAKFHVFAEDYSSYAEKNYPGDTTTFAISTVSQFLKNQDKLALKSYLQLDSDDFCQKFLRVIVAAIVPGIRMPDLVSEFEEASQRLGYRWVEMEIANLRAIKDNAGGQAQTILENLKQTLSFEPVGNIVPRLEDWERALNTLLMVAEKVQGTGNGTSAKLNETRVAWLIDFGGKAIQPVEQKFSRKGWTDGRNIALKRLFERDVRNITEQDSLVVKTSMKKYQDYSYYGTTYYEFDWAKALLALAGHPFLFLMKNPGVNVQIEAGEPSLVIKEINDDLELSFDTKFSEVGVLVQKETESRYKLISISKHHLEIANSFKNNKLKIPSAGREKLLKAIQPLSTKLAVQSDLEEHFENLPALESDPRIHALITPDGEGFHLEFFVKPFDKVPPYFKPGKGVESVITDIDGVRTRTRRDLKNERKLIDEIEALCPFLAESETPNYEWKMPDAAACLTALAELETPRSANKLVIEWPKGQKLKLLGSITFENFSLSVKGKNNWFEVDANVQVSEDLVLSMRELRQVLDQKTEYYVEISDGQFIAIAEKLRKHLRSLNSVLDDKNRLHPLRSGILDEFTDEFANFKADKAWRDHLQRIKTARTFVPEIPATFDADLRPYQIDGCHWLLRFAHWGVGACLADDMGFGKTLQASAILVDRAESGAALVVAPVSVCRNWVKEARRFAPTLNFKIFGEGDRKTQVESLGKYDVLVSSYNLLQVEEEFFTSRRFATIVLDEAQAIKNRSTKRSKTVMNLQGDFRLITTGTPIENHLGELWNLFNFLNPGLLGSHDFFNERFAVPIEKNKDENARKTLQRLIQPFILRRRKNQVLDDLPPKTEIMLTVEMSAEERAFYEAVRREAIEKIETTDGDAKDKRFRILAELTRLRLACCHPKLVDENIPLGSSKLELFGETLAELLENKHKALVFSQFVKHLGIVEKYLQSKGIAYHYLDGSTPPHIRQERIDDFQRGNRDVFLISLKAGGTGLNLTAADYVIHLDPWWNPAVEDQATDRVHRIGQQRPVTVYRLVTENTVEEKILKLHDTKRDLADSLLDGTDSSGKLSAEDLMALISEV